jgi:hypothetical protein
MPRHLASSEAELQRALLLLRELRATRKHSRSSQPAALLELAELVKHLAEPTRSLTTMAAESLRLRAEGPVAELPEPRGDRILGMIERWIRVQLRSQERV